MTHVNLSTVTLLVGMTGAGISIWGLFSAITDMNFLTARNLNGARRIVAMNNVSRQAFRMAVQIVVVASGSYARLDSGSDPVMLGFFIIVATLVLISEVIDRLRRVQLEHLYDRMIQSTGRRSTDKTLAAVMADCNKNHDV